MIKTTVRTKNANKTKAIVLIIIYAIITFLDCFFTFLATPDLAREANPLVRDLGFGWGVLITTNILVLLAYSVLVYYSFVIYKTPVITVKNSEELGRKARETSGKGSFFAMLGYGLSYSMIIARSLLVIDWAFVLAGSSWEFFRSIAVRTPAGRPDLFVTVILAFILIIVWFVKETKRVEAAAIIQGDESLEKEEYYQNDPIN